MKPRTVRMRRATAGLGASLVLGVASFASAAPPTAPASNGPPVVYQKSRTFRVPFHFNPEERARRRELQLWSSDDLGRNWVQKGATTPDQPTFTFTADHDGEFLLAIRTLDVQGRYHPADDAQIEPSMKVVVDTKSPAITLEPRPRSASLASVRWEIHDDNPSPSDYPKLQYRVVGTTDWQPVPIKQGGPVGVSTWDTGYTEPLQVRATAVDRAGNMAEVILDLGSSKPGQALSATEPKPAAPLTAATTPAAAPTTPAPAPTTAAAAPTTAAAAPTTAAAAVGSTLTPASAVEAMVPAGASVATPQHADGRAEPAVTSGAAPAPHEGRIAGRAPVASVYPSAQDVPLPDPGPALPAPAAIAPPPAASTADGAQTAPFAGRLAPDAPSEQTLAAEFTLDQVATAPASPPTASVPTDRGESAPRPDLGLPPEVGRDLVSNTNPPQAATRPRTESPTPQPRPRLGEDPGVGTASLASPSQTAAAPAPDQAAASSPPARLKVPGPRFLLDYAVDRAGPDGRPATVELWVTVDGGKTWSKRGDDPDRKSPILVNLNEAGTYGVSLVARDSNGLGDRPPAPGEAPKLWIDVDAPSKPATAPSLLPNIFRR